MSPSRKNQPYNQPYKKYQCRYFDERGRSLIPSCREGRNCRFVHPEDSNWPGLKCHPRKGSSGNSSQSSWMKHDIRAKSVSPLSRGAPLVPQNALFRRVKLETEDEISLNFESEGSRRNETTAQTTRFHSPSFDDGDARGRKVERFVAANDSTFQANKANTITPLPNQTESQTNAEAETAANARSELLISMFRDVAMVTSQIIQDAVLCDQEERKLQTFNEISATLAKISSSSTQAVAGPVADVILAHAQSKERLNQNFRLLGAAWEKIFNGLMADFSLCLDNRLQAALSSVENEAEIAMNGIIAGSNQLKRRRVSISPEPDRQEGRRLKADTNYYASHYDEYGSSGHAHSSTKRSRLAGRSRSSSPDPRQKDVTHNRTSVVKISLDDILNQMKMKIDQQSSSLQSLSKENEELKSQLQHPSSPPRGPRSQRLEPSSLTESTRAGTSSSQKSSSYAHESDTRRHSSSGHRHHSRTDSKR